MNGSASHSASVFDLAIVIPARNAAGELPHQLRALASQEWDRRWEVVVADNGSTDATVRCVEEFVGAVPGLRVVDASEKASQAFALNRGAAATDAPLLLFLDADDEVTPGYIAAMARALETDALVGARLDSDALNAPWLRRSRPAAQADGIGASFGLLPAAAGCSLGVRRELFEQIGGFDTTVPICQDIDFCWRAQLAGASIGFVPDAVLRYRYRPGFRAIYRQAKGYGRSGPALYSRYRYKGMPRRSPRTAVRFWGAAAVRLLKVRSRADLGAWLFLAGFRVGLLQGCIAHRVVYV